MDHYVLSEVEKSWQEASRLLAGVFGELEMLPPDRRWARMTALCDRMDRELAPFLIRAAGELSEEKGMLPSRPERLGRALGVSL